MEHPHHARTEQSLNERLPPESLECACVNSTTTTIHTFMNSENHPTSEPDPSGDLPAEEHGTSFVVRKEGVAAGVGTAVGTVTGAATGAAIGALGGPLGMGVGALVGATVGGVAGNAAGASVKEGIGEEDPPKA